MSLDTWLIYLAAAIGLSLSPGPNGLLALTHGALHGRRLTLYTIAGGALGFVLVIALSMFGIGALLKTSLLWLTVLKWVGGAYLVWLGVQVWRSPPLGEGLAQAAAPRSGASLFRQGLLSAVSNPKAVLFFAAFLPQFIDPARPLWPQVILLMVTFDVLAAAIQGAYIFAMGRARNRIASPRVLKNMNRVGGAMLVGAGLFTATLKRN